MAVNMQRQKHAEANKGRIMETKEVEQGLKI